MGIGIGNTTGGDALRSIIIPEPMQIIVTTNPFHIPGSSLRLTSIYSTTHRTISVDVQKCSKQVPFHSIHLRLMAELFQALILHIFSKYCDPSHGRIKFL